MLLFLNQQNPKKMFGTSNNPILPLLSFDLYLEHYHNLVKTFKKDVDLAQIHSLLKRNTEQQFQDLIKRENYDAIVITTLDQHIVWVNDGFVEMTGYHRNYALGKRPTFLQGGETSNKTKKQIKEQLETGRNYSGSIVNYKKNGESYRCQIKIVPLYNSKKELTHFMALEKELKVA